MVPYVDGYEEVVHVHVPHILTRHDHRIFLVRLLQGITRNFTLLFSSLPMGFASFIAFLPADKKFSCLALAMGFRVKILGLG